MSHQQNPDVSVRRRFDAQEKVVILRQHLVEKVPVSEVCEVIGELMEDHVRLKKSLGED